MILQKLDVRCTSMWSDTLRRLFLLFLTAIPVTPMALRAQAMRGYHTVHNARAVINAFPQPLDVATPPTEGSTPPRKRLKGATSDANGNKVHKPVPGPVQSILTSLHISPPPPSRPFTKERLAMLRRLTSKNITCAFVYVKTIDSNGTEYYDSDVRFEDVNIEIVNQLRGSSGGDGDAPSDHQYDQQGAMYFAVAVITIYGLSIALLIATSMRRSNEDYELKGFIRSFAQLDPSKTKKPRDKSRIQKALLESGMLFRLTAQVLPSTVLPTLLGPSAKSAVAPSDVVGGMGAGMPGTSRKGTSGARCSDADGCEEPEAMAAESNHEQNARSPPPRTHLVANEETKLNMESWLPESETHTNGNSAGVAKGAKVRLPEIFELPESPTTGELNAALNLPPEEEGGGLGRLGGDGRRGRTHGHSKVLSPPVTNGDAPSGWHGMRRVQIYQGAELGKVDVRIVGIGSDISLDILEEDATS